MTNLEREVMDEVDASAKLRRGKKETESNRVSNLVPNKIRKIEEEVTTLDDGYADKGMKGSKAHITKSDSELAELGLKDPEYGAKQMDEEIDRIEMLMAKDAVDDPLFPNPSHPRSLTSKRIKASGNQVEINEEIQDIVGLFEQRGIGTKQTGMFDVKKLKKATLNPSPALKAAAKGDPTKKATRAAIEKIAAIKVNSRLWDAWDKLSGLAPLARKGDQKALAEVRAIGDWLIKAKRSPTPLANLEGPRREITAGGTMTTILNDMVPSTRTITPKPSMSVGSNLSNELGPKMPPLLEQLKRNRTGFNPKNLGGTTMTPEEALRRQGNR